jgi:hypothetical protein
VDSGGRKRIRTRKIESLDQEIKPDLLRTAGVNSSSRELDHLLDRAGPMGRKVADAKLSLLDPVFRHKYPELLWCSVVGSIGQFF